MPTQGGVIPTWRIDYESPPVAAEGIGRRMIALEAEMIVAFRRINRQGRLVQANAVAQLEAQLEGMWGIKKAMAVSSGTAALRLAYEYVKGRRSAQPSPPYEIITTPLSYITTAYAASEAGLKIVFADIDPYTFTLDPQSVRQALSPHTIAIVPVHLYGQPADMAALLRLAQEAGVAVIEDMCQSQSATYLGTDGLTHYVGSESLFACTSFYCGKIVGGIDDAGAIFTHEPDLLPLLRGGRDQGRASGQRYWHEQFGWKFRLGEFNAAVISLQLGYLAQWITRRRQIAAAYTNGLVDLEGLTLPFEAPGRRHVYYKYPVLLPTSRERERLEQQLRERGVETERIYPHLICDQPWYAQGKLPNRVEEIRVARSVVGRLLCLPMHEQLTDGEVDRVVRAVRVAYGRAVR